VRIDVRARGWPAPKTTPLGHKKTPTEAEVC